MNSAGAFADVPKLMYISVLRPINGQEGRAVHGHHSSLITNATIRWVGVETLILAKGLAKVLTQPRCRKRNAKNKCRWEPKASILRLLPRLVLLPRSPHQVVEPGCTSIKGKEDRRSRFPTTCASRASFSSSLPGNRSRASSCLFIIRRARWGNTGTHIENLVVANRRPSRDTRARHTHTTITTTVPSTSAVNRDLTSQSRLEFIN